MDKMIENKRRLPAEWEPQDGVLLAWPHADSDWQPILSEITAVFIELTRQIQRFERTLIVTPDPESVRETLSEAGIELSTVRIEKIPTNDTWTRDYGPITVICDNQPVLLDFGFNGWGLKFAADKDNQVTSQLHANGCFGTTAKNTIGLILEGGSIESDGVGTILTSSECLLNNNRNPQLNKQQVEQVLADHLGAEHILWLDHGYLSGDDTDSHIDTLARLCPDDTISYLQCRDPQDEHFSELQKMELQLQQFRTREGKPFRLIPLPWPAVCYDEDGDRLPATYANFLVINGAVLVPTYNDAADEQALAAIAEAYPNREIIGIDCRAVIWQHGSLHCLTMQLPEGVLR